MCNECVLIYVFLSEDFWGCLVSFIFTFFVLIIYCDIVEDEEE